MMGPQYFASCYGQPFGIIGCVFSVFAVYALDHAELGMIWIMPRSLQCRASGGNRCRTEVFRPFRSALIPTAD